MNTHETYVSLETAKLLKQAGFNWEVKTYYHYLSPYDEYNLEFDSISTNYNHLNNADFSAPTLAVAQKWLREVKNTQIIASPLAGSKKWTFLIAKDFWLLHKDISGIALTPESFDTYEEALEAGINKCLTLILEENANR